MDSDGEDCGLFCSALNRLDSYLYGRLIFNEMKQLIGFGVNSGMPGYGEELYGVHSQWTPNLKDISDTPTSETSKEVPDEASAIFIEILRFGQNKYVLIFTNDGFYSLFSTINKGLSH